MSEFQASGGSDGVPTFGDFATSFTAAYKREFGFDIPGRVIVVDDVRVRCVGRSGVGEQWTLAQAEQVHAPPVLCRTSACFAGRGRVDVDVHSLTQLLAGHTVTGPALIVDPNGSIVVEPGCTAVVTRDGNVLIDVSVA